MAVDDEGEVLARSNHVFAGYWEQPVETEAALEGGWFHTGDGGYVDDDAYVVISDRKKDVIITGGENVSSIEVEDCLYQHPAVAEVAVIGIPHPDLGEEIGAAVALKPGASATPDELREFARDKMAAYKYPRQVWLVEALPKGPTGKILRREVHPPEDAS
jgi:long-chain acyl-CoA synthetase